MQLDIVYLSTNGDLGQRQAVTNLHLCVLTVHNLHANLQSLRSQDVSLLAILIADESDVSCTVRIVLDTDYGSVDIIFLSLEIDDSVFSSGTASAVSNCNLSLIVTTCIFL